MGIFEFFSAKSTFSPTNEIEVMLERKELETNPRRFFEVLISQELFILTHSRPEVAGEHLFRAGETIDFVVLPSAKGAPTSLVYTSLAALTFYTRKVKFEGGFVRADGRSLIEMLIANGVGMQLNRGHEHSPYSGVENLQFALHEISMPLDKS